METRDYSKFKLLKTNRLINEKNVEKIMASIKEWGIIPGRPVLVDGDYNIIDGQHRFMAIKKLGHPVPYEIISGDVISKTMALNANQSQWKLIDYIRSYSEQGHDCYRKLLKFEEKYNLGVTNSIMIFTNRNVNSLDIRKGKQFEPNTMAEDIAEFISSLDTTQFSKTKHFCESIVSLYLKATKEQAQCVKENILKVPKCADVKDYLTVFENIINFRKRGKNKIKF